MCWAHISGEVCMENYGGEMRSVTRNWGNWWETNMSYQNSQNVINHANTWTLGLPFFWKTYQFIIIPGGKEMLQVPETTGKLISKKISLYYKKKYNLPPSQHKYIWQLSHSSYLIMIKKKKKKTSSEVH